MKNYVKKSLKIVLWIIATVVGIFLLLVIALQIPYIQNQAKNQLVSYLEGKIKTKIIVERIEIGFPKKVILENFYFEDQQKDTLLAGKRLAVDINLFQLLNNKVEINSIDLQKITANISRNEKDGFNFDYIIKAFSTAKKPKDNSPPMQFLVDKINLDNVKFKYLDAISKNNIYVTLKHFDTQIKTFDLDKMSFEIPKAKIDGLNLKLEQGLVETLNEIKEIVEEKADENNLKIQLGKIDLSKIAIDYKDETSKLTTKIAFQKFVIQFNSIDLKNQFLDIRALNLSEMKGDLAFGKIETKKSTKKIKSATSNSWKIKIKNADLKKVSFRFDDQNDIPIKNGIDYRHLDIENFNLRAKNFDYNSKKTTGTVLSLSVKEKKGLEVQSAKTSFVYTDKGVSLKNLYLKTPGTLLKDEIIVGYPSALTIEENLGEMDLKANLIKSKLSFKDLLLFAPTLINIAPFATYPNAIVNINSKIKGKLKNITFPYLEISGIGNTKISASGKIIGLPDFKKAYFDLDVKKLQSNSKDVYAFVPQGTIPNTIEIPNQFEVKGLFRGTLTNFSTNMNLVSSFGNAKIKAVFDQRKKDQEKYDAKTELDNFDLGKLIKDNAVGKITLQASIKGKGLNPKTANAQVDGIIQKANFNKYNYQNVKLKGKINNGFFNLNANANDPNLVFDMVSNGSFKDKYPALKLMLNIDIADLNKLNLHAGPMKMRGIINADFQTLDLDYLNGTVTTNKFIIANQIDQFVLDSINVVAISNSDQNSILIKSQFANAAVNGKYKLSQISNVIQNSISRYYTINSKSKKSNYENQYFTFNIDVKDSPILFKLIPELKSLEPMNFSGKYNSVNDTLVFQGSIPRMVYGDNKISGAVFKIDTKDNSLVYNFIIGAIENTNFQLPYTILSGKAENNILDYKLQLKDFKDKERYLIAGNLKSNYGNSEIKLDPANLILNYEAWNLSEENLIRFGQNGIYINNFNLNKGTNAIKMQSENDSPNAPLLFDFKDFEIETVTNIAQKSDLQIGGKINGTALIKDVQKTPIFTSDLNVENFTFQKDTVGNLKISIDNKIANTYTAKVELTGQENQLNLDGNFKTLNSSFDMKLDIQRLNVKSIQGFTFGNITKSTGFLNGNFLITGTTTKPNIIGELKFNNVGFKAKQLNAKFKSINDKIVFSDNTIAFNNFAIRDENNNDLVIRGKINSTDYSNLGFDLIVDADNFKAVNSKEKDNKIFYGELFLDNHLIVKGTMNAPFVEGTIKVNKDTKFTIVLPQDDPSIADREGIVEFIDQDQPKLITTVNLDENLSQTEIKGMNASVNIEVDKDAELSLIIDKANGDYLKLKGEAQLSGGIDSSGKTTLTGRYELSEGSYEMSFNLIKRKFDIKKGSYLLWTGEPTTANINITAVYKIETAPLDLLNDQLGNISEDVRNTYKQKIPFETELKMKGDLLKPDISFDIVLPEGNNSVSGDIITATQAKLAQLRLEPDELNKQVFALLLLNRFIGENPFSSESGGTTANSLARESVTKILSQQLNNLAGDLIKGFEVDFDLDSTEDYTTGKKENKTDLNVGLSKRLLNDRLKVTIGSSFGIEGPKQENQQTNNIAGDISADYSISKDGRYKLRAYRKNKYQVALQGQVIETGVGFIITLDYNKFKELFQKNKTEKTKKKSNE